MDEALNQTVAVIGAGPAGLFAAKELATQGIKVTLLNRDIKPGGLAEYGIFHNKYKMKNGLRAQFRQVLAHPNIDYYGNVTVGKDSDLSLEQLRSLGFSAILVTAGAQGTKWLGLPGEDLAGVYHAKEVVYYYNKLPPFSQNQLVIGKKVAVIGVGNVMLDIVHFLIADRLVDEVVAVARRGPDEIKFDRKELDYVIGNLDVKAVEFEIDRVAHIMTALGQDPQAAKAFYHEAKQKLTPPLGHAIFKLRFLSSPIRMIDNGRGAVGGLEVEENTLVAAGDDTKARGLGTYHTLEVDTVIFAIGDKVDENLGLPVHGSVFDKNPNPRYPVEGVSYEAFSSDEGRPLEGVFVAGWSRVASTGLVGLARKDGVNGAKAIMQYLRENPAGRDDASIKVAAMLQTLAHPVATKDTLAALESAERERAEMLGVEEFKFTSNTEMLEAMGLIGVRP
ncbi:MAG TPA: FAD-dependent oxidoreductase [Bellilinea sp.]|nr:FAD-dependent oxidoreductase [Bellilinea sp.]